MLTPHPNLQCRGLKLGRAIPLPALRTLVACKGGTFTFTIRRELPTFSFVKGFMRLKYVGIRSLPCCFYANLSINITSKPTAIFPLYEMGFISFHCFRYFRTEKLWTCVTNNQASHALSRPVLVLSLLIRRKC